MIHVRVWKDEEWVLKTVNHAQGVVVDVPGGQILLTVDQDGLRVLGMENAPLSVAPVARNVMLLKAGSPGS